MAQAAPARCPGQVPVPCLDCAQPGSRPWAPSPRTTSMGRRLWAGGIGLLGGTELHMLGMNVVLILNPEGHLG